jgi:hypothetical protein
MATLNELIAQLNASSDRILADADRMNIAADNMNKTLDDQLGVKEVSGVAELLSPGRTIGEQRDADMYATGQLQYSDVLPQDYGYLGANAPFPEQGLMSQAKNLFNKFIGSGGIIGVARDAIGNILPQRSALDSYMLDTYGGYGPTGGQDKYGYNIINAANNYMVPGSSSFRSAQLEGLRGLDQNVANQFYMDNYGKTYEQVYKDAQKKKDPFNQTVDVGSGADYYGGDDTPSGGNQDIGSRVSQSYESVQDDDYGLI